MSGKKQHYVPRFYLKYFSIDKNEKSINLYHCNKNIFIQNADLKNQAYENFFYGKDGLLEDGLGELEGQASSVFNKIISDKKLPRFDSKEYSTLLFYTLLQAGRTRSHMEEMNRAALDSLDAVLGDAQEYKEMKESGHKLVIEGNAPILVKVAADSYPIAKDLACKLIINKGTSPFITSDSPVVKANPFLQRKKFSSGRLGIATKGLQLIFPVSPDLLLIFYDNKVYKVSDRRKFEIEISNSSDINNLNLLQFMNCEEVVYCNQDVKEGYFNGFKSPRTHYLKNKINSNKKIFNEKTKDGTIDQVYHSYTIEPEMNISFSFIKETVHAKTYLLNGSPIEVRDSKLMYKY